MGARGPKRTPTATLAQRGSWLAKTRKGEPTPERLPECPAAPGDLMTSARNIWAAMAPSLWASGRLTADDVPAFARYCRTHARFTELDANLDITDRGAVMNLRDLHNMLKEYDARFGLTPSDRAEMAVASPGAAKGKRAIGSGGLSVVA
jgi:phage terminase small subunit